MTTIFKNLPPYLESGNKCAHEFGLPGPEFVILELPRAVIDHAREELGVNFSDPRTTFYGIDEIMERIFCYVGERHSARQGIDSLAEHLVADADAIDKIDDGTNAAQEATALGEVVINGLKTNGLYDSNGLFYYAFAGWADPYSAILVKYLEEDPADIEYMNKLPVK